MYETDKDHLATCDKPLALCPACAQAFGLTFYPPEIPRLPLDMRPWAN